jgi:hypothetical protein
MPFHIVGHVATDDLLPNPSQAGEGYLVGPAPSHIYMALDDGTYYDYGPVEGPEGPVGPSGHSFCLANIAISRVSGASVLLEEVSAPAGWEVRIDDLVVDISGAFFKVTAIDDSNCTLDFFWAPADPFPAGGTEGQLLATGPSGREWIDPPVSLPSGGLEGQVLRRSGGTSVSAEWSDDKIGDLDEVTTGSNENVVAALNELDTGLKASLPKKTMYEDTSWEWFKPEIDGGGHWYWDFSTSTLRFEGFNNDVSSPIVWERYSISGGGPNFQITGGSRIGARLLVAWDSGTRGQGSLRTYYTVNKATSDFTAEDEITSRDWVRALVAGETGKPLSAAENHAALLAITGMKINDWIYVEDDTYTPQDQADPVHVGETWAYAYDGTNWVELVRINEVQVQDDDITIEIDSVSGKRRVKAGGIGATQLASGAATDSVIGTRQVEDNQESGSLPDVETGFTLGQWLQNIRDNLKFVFAKFISKVDVDQTVANRNNDLMTDDTGKVVANRRRTVVYDTTAQYEADVALGLPEGQISVVLDQYPDGRISPSPDHANKIVGVIAMPAVGTLTNWISSTYTVPQNGYINFRFCLSVTGEVPPTFATVYLTSGGTRVFSMGSATPTSNFIGGGLIEVAKGDTVSVAVESNDAGKSINFNTNYWICNFIPKKYSVAIAPRIVAEVDGDYSLTEKPVMTLDRNTGQYRQALGWNNKPMYQCTFQAASPATAGSSIIADLATLGANDNYVQSAEYDIFTNNDHVYAEGNYYLNGDLRIELRCVVQGGVIKFVSFVPATVPTNWLNSPIKATLRYTKDN